MIIWIIGLSGSGKTKLSRELFKSKIISSNFISIDGDEFRRNISEDLGYSYRDRKKNAERISRFVAYLSKKNINIIVSVLSNYPKWLDWNKSNIKSYYQVYLKVDRQKLFSRVPVGYAQGLKTLITVAVQLGYVHLPHPLQKCYFTWTSY